MPKMLRQALKSYATSIWANTDPITKWVQVVALALAAYWTVTRYLLVEAPSLERNVGITSDLTEEFRVSTGCYVKYAITINNGGNVSFDVSKIQIRGWRANLPGLSGSEESQFLNLDVLESSKLIVDTDRDFSWFPAEGLVRHYSSKQNFTQSFSWVIPVRNSTLCIFRADVYSGQQWLGHSRSARVGLCNEKKAERE
jgi:hypothetical protein